MKKPRRPQSSKLKAEIVKIDPSATVTGTDVIGPKVSGELAWAGILSVVIASLAMLFYIWWRFEWPFAVGAIVTLVLDVTKAIGFFALTGLDFNLTAIAAILTLVGYSVNDKVVVYDRMRENMRLYKSMPLREIIDRSINETLARSLYTNATAFLALLPMAIWGGSAVESFAVPMVFGILVAGCLVGLHCSTDPALPRRLAPPPPGGCRHDGSSGGDHPSGRGPAAQDRWLRTMPR